MAILNTFARLPENVLEQYPSGRWGFVGRCNLDLAYCEQDGSPLSEERIRDLRQVGPGILKIKSRSWPTRESALEALRELEAD